VKIITPAKVNLSLKVRSLDESGYHPLLSIVQAIEPVDSLTVEMGDEDLLEIEGIRLPVDDDNLIWRALRAAVPGRKKGLHIKLTKEIPTAAGLGGGSSDAAAALLVASQMFGFEYQRDIAASVGADVPFFRTGGLARMEGYGEILTPLDAAVGFHLGLLVPPFDLSTPAVYGAWDGLDFPETLQVAGSDLPPSLRQYGPLTNDLYPAALVLAPQLDDWRSELAHRWNRPVLMSGSGPSLFAFFGSSDEAAEAIDVVPAGSRFAGAVAPLGHGATVVADG
jgi:4-diphosphocytidyl-2-C-methyl-D-erythritol kinase